MFYTINDLDQMLIHNVTKTLADMERSYQREFEYAISEIRHAHCDMVCFGVRDAQLWDHAVLSAVQSALHAENVWKQARDLYDEVMEHYYK